MALGWDLALAHASVLTGIPFTAAVPCDAQESRWPPSSQAYYRRLLTLSDDVVVVSPGGYKPWKMQVRNEWMVDQCDLLLALWDGSRGGKANCCWYAQRIERPIENLWREWTRLNDSDSAFGIWRPGRRVSLIPWHLATSAFISWHLATGSWHLATADSAKSRFLHWHLATILIEDL